MKLLKLPSGIRGLLPLIEFTFHENNGWQSFDYSQSLVLPDVYVRGFQIFAAERFI